MSQAIKNAIEPVEINGKFTVDFGKKQMEYATLADAQQAIERHNRHVAIFTATLDARRELFRAMDKNSGKDYSVNRRNYRLCKALLVNNWNTKKDTTPVSRACEIAEISEDDFIALATGAYRDVVAHIKALFQAGMVQLGTNPDTGAIITPRGLAIRIAGEMTGGTGQNADTLRELEASL